MFGVILHLNRVAPGIVGTAMAIPAGEAEHARRPSWKGDSTWVGSCCLDDGSDWMMCTVKATAGIDQGDLVKTAACSLPSRAC